MPQTESGTYQYEQGLKLACWVSIIFAVLGSWYFAKDGLYFMLIVTLGVPTFVWIVSWNYWSKKVE